MVGFLFFGQTFAILNLIQETRHLVNIEAYNFFLMNLGELQKRSGVILNPLGPVKVVVKALTVETFRMIPRSVFIRSSRFSVE